MKTLPFFLCSLSISFTAHAETPENTASSFQAPLSLNAVTDAALAANPAIKEARARWEARKQQIPQVAAWDDPKFSATTRVGRFVEISRNGFADQMLSVEQMIPISGKNRSRERIAAAEALGALEELRRKELDIVARARTAWFRLARDYALLDLNRANESSLAQTVEIGRARLEVGNQGQAEVLMAQTEMNRLEEARHDLMRSISEDETQLKVLMHRDPFGSLGKPADVSLPPHEHLSEEQLRASLLGNRPEVRQAEADLTAAKAKLELARREWIPDPSVSVQAQRYNGAAQVVSELDAGISFSVPWLNGRKYRAEEREAQSGVEAARQKLENARFEALGLLRDQLQKIETFHHHIELFQSRLLPNARQTVQTIRANYESGKAGLSDLLLSERSLREMEAMLQQHMAEYRTSVVELETLTGARLGSVSSRKETMKGGSK